MLDDHLLVRVLQQSTREVRLEPRPTADCEGFGTLNVALALPQALIGLFGNRNGHVR